MRATSEMLPLVRRFGSESAPRPACELVLVLRSQHTCHARLTKNGWTKQPNVRSRVPPNSRSHPVAHLPHYTTSASGRLSTTVDRATGAISPCFLISHASSPSSRPGPSPAPTRAAVRAARPRRDVLHSLGISRWKTVATRGKLVLLSTPDRADSLTWTQLRTTTRRTRKRWRRCLSAPLTPVIRPYDRCHQHVFHRSY